MARQKLISNNEDKAFSVLYRSTRKSLGQIYLRRFSKVIISRWDTDYRVTATRQKLSSRLAYARGISPVKRREGEEERWWGEEEGGEQVYAFTFSFDGANCVAWKPGRRKYRRESESTIDEPPVIVMQLLLKRSCGSRSTATFHSGNIGQRAAPVEPILSEQESNCGPLFSQWTI